jgi:hypothetical protein
VTKVSDTLWQVFAQVVDVESAETLRAESVMKEGRFVVLVQTGVRELAVNLAGATAMAAPTERGRAAILSKPNGADIVLDGQPIADKTDAVLEDLLAGPHTVTVTKGTLYGKQTFNVVSGGLARVELALAQKSAALRINSTPPDATVLLDGRDIGRTPAVVEDVAPGQHTVTVTKGALAGTQTFDVAPGELLRVEVPLVATSLRIESTPSDAIVLLDGREFGRTPLVLEGVSVGQHTITVYTITVSEGTLRGTQLVNVAPGKLTRVEIPLVPGPAVSLAQSGVPPPREAPPEASPFVPLLAAMLLVVLSTNRSQSAAASSNELRGAAMFAALAIYLAAREPEKVAALRVVPLPDGSGGARLMLVQTW